MSICRLVLRHASATGAGVFVAVSAAHAIPGPASLSPTDRPLVQRVDARAYRHCHNLPRRTYCHKRARLPRNWPANTDTPARKREPCWVNSAHCLLGRQRTRDAN